MSRLWILPVLGLIAVLGIACGDEGEDVPAATMTLAPTEETSASTLTAAPSATPAPSAPPDEKTTLWRWVNVTIVVPQTGFSVLRSFSNVVRPGGAPTIEIFRTDTSGVPIDSGIFIDATTGEILLDRAAAAHKADFETLAATISVSEPVNLPWPYAEEEPAGPRFSEGKISYLEPPPAAGLIVTGGAGISSAGGSTFLVIENTRSHRFIDPDTGNVQTYNEQVAPEDAAAFDRWTGSIKLESP